MASTDKLRYVPPVAALGTAFVLQVVVITDTVGTAAARIYPHAGGWPYIPAALLGIAVASCAEGGAAYLMDLYDKHLLARDSVWLLRIAMAAYVAVSGLAIHWWTEQRGLPVVISWLLSAMSASALFLWARGARWRNRQQMIAAGQIDPAMPRLPMSAKGLHPVRWAVTLWLISWNPVATTDQARARYDEWRDRRTGKTARTELYVQSMVADAEQRATATLDDALRIADLIGQTARAELSVYWQAATEQVMAMQADTEQQTVKELSAAQADADTVRLSAEQAAAQVMAAARAEADRLIGEAEAARQAAEKLHADAARRTEQAVKPQPSRRAPDSAPSVRKVPTGQPSSGRAEVSVEQLADTLDEHFPDRVPGRPSAMAVLKQVHHSCSGDRARAAIDVLSARRNGHREQTPDAERLQLTGPVNGHRPELTLIGAAS